MKCKLCDGEFVPKEKSHIVSAFVYKWLKKTSATGYLRLGSQMNQRVQDGIKDYFLCPTCEDIIGRYETAFSRKIFHPYTQNFNFKTEYDTYFLKYAVSACWRVLAYRHSQKCTSHVEAKHHDRFFAAEETWRKFILGEKHDVGVYQIHYLDLCGVTSHKGRTMPININRYLRRSTDVEVFCNSEEAFVYVKLGPLLFIGLIRYPNLDHWVNTIIGVEGRFGPKKCILPIQYLNLLCSRAEKIGELESKISPNQMKEIEQTYDHNLERTLNSDTLKSTIMDLQLGVFQKDNFSK